MVFVIVKADKLDLYFFGEKNIHMDQTEQKENIGIGLELFC